MKPQKGRTAGRWLAAAAACLFCRNVAVAIRTFGTSQQDPSMTYRIAMHAAPHFNLPDLLQTVVLMWVCLCLFLA